jgi:hypothetical protein
MVDRDGATVTVFSSLMPDEHLESCVSVQPERIARLHGVEFPHDRETDDQASAPRSSLVCGEAPMTEQVSWLSTASWERIS